MRNEIKKTSWLLLILSIFLLYSCSTIRNRIFYNYRNITIERVDYNAETDFYCYKDGVKQPGYVYAVYRGMGGMFDGWLVFKPDGRVLFVVGNGVFKVKGNADFALFRSWNPPSKDYEVGQKGVCFIHIGVKLEQQTNKEEHADPEIRAIYFNYE